MSKGHLGGGRQASSRRIGQHDTGKASAWGFGFEDKKPVPTFKEHVKMWLSLPHEWKESTRENYLNSLNKHILPHFGTTPVNEVIRKDLKFFFNKRYAEGPNPKP
jgi:hypothetical protein